jgi:hypothetical protein
MTPVEQVLVEVLHLSLNLRNVLEKSSRHKNGRKLDGIGIIPTGLPIFEGTVCRKGFCLVLLFYLDP